MCDLVRVAYIIIWTPALIALLQTADSLHGDYALLLWSHTTTMRQTFILRTTINHSWIILQWSHNNERNNGDR